MEIKTIGGLVNCYLIQTDAGFFLVDTGMGPLRRRIERELENAGCGPGDLKLIILTHGDVDHIANAVYLRNKYGAKIVMHPDDAEMAEHGDASPNRKKGRSPLMRVSSALFRREKFKPDFLVDEGDDLSRFGLDARVLHLPGHSKGSIGILTNTGSFFCGDLLANQGRPSLHSIQDDPEVMRASAERLKEMDIYSVFPGHGRPFQMRELKL